LGRKIRRHRQAVEDALRSGTSNALIESTNTKIRVLTRVAFGVPLPRCADRHGHARCRRLLPRPPRTAQPASCRAGRVGPRLSRPSPTSRASRWGEGPSRFSVPASHLGGLKCRLPRAVGDHWRHGHPARPLRSVPEQRGRL
jgi:hypothetical protein